MRVLIACEESQAVCIAFRERGHEAYSCDIQEPSGGHPEWHICGDALAAIRGGYIVTMDGVGHHVGKWDLLIAHPPCTYLTNAGAVRMTVKGELQRERYEKAMAARDFFMQMWTASVERIAIENPTPMGIVKLPPPTQVIQPFQFGHPYSKRTCLWLKNLPTLIPTSFISNYEPYVNGGCKDAYGRCRRFQGRNERDQKTRSKTFPGIAAAMADQWGTHGGYVQMTLLEEIEE